MKRNSANERAILGRKLNWITLGMVLIWTVGCQAMMAAKAKKELQNRDKFHCGEPMPSRVQEAPIRTPGT